MSEGLTTRERRLARAARREEWAEGRAAKAIAAEASASRDAEHIPFGQPILVGHHSEGRARRDHDRITRGYQRAGEHAAMAEEHARKADNIRRAVDAAIYDDDPDVIERLTEKLAALEARREAMKAANAAFRKAHRGELAAMSAYERGQALPHPAFELTNLTGNIGRTRKRLQRLGGGAS